MVKFHEGLSEHSVYMRYFHALKLDQRVAHERLTRICFIDYDRELVLVAIRREPVRQIVGIARLSKIYGSDAAEFAILIDDNYQGQGLGTELLKRLIKAAAEEPDLSFLQDAKARRAAYGRLETAAYADGRPQVLAVYEVQSEKPILRFHQHRFAKLFLQICPKTQQVDVIPKHMLPQACKNAKTDRYGKMRRLLQDWAIDPSFAKALWF